MFPVRGAAVMTGNGPDSKVGRLQAHRPKGLVSVSEGSQAAGETGNLRDLHRKGLGCWVISTWKCFSMVIWCREFVPLGRSEQDGLSRPVVP